MVHGLRTIIALNERAARKTGRAREKSGQDIPSNIASNPVRSRAFVNRPWNESERANREPVKWHFARKEGLAEPSRA